MSAEISKNQVIQNFHKSFVISVLKKTIDSQQSQKNTIEFFGSESEFLQTTSQSNMQFFFQIIDEQVTNGLFHC